MVVPVEEYKGLLVNDYEERVEQLGELAQDEKLDPKARGSGAVQRRGIVA